MTFTRTHCNAKKTDCHFLLEYIIEPGSPASLADSLSPELPGKP